MTVIEKLSTEEIIQLYPKILKELKKRGVIRTKNFIGDIGEFLAIEGYNKNPNVPNLERAMQVPKVMMYFTGNKISNKSSKW